MTKRLSLLLALSLFALTLSACGAKASDVPRTVVMPTAEPTHTPLPPVETAPALGSVENPLLFLFVVPDAGAAAPLADELTARLNENGDYFYLVHVTESYREAREAFCEGDALMVSLDTFSYLSLGETPCGQPVYVVEKDGQTASQGQFIGNDTFAPRVYRGRYCRVDAFSLDTWVMPRLFLLSEDVDPFLNLSEIIDKGSDRAVIEAVLSGECAMAAISVGSEEANADLPDSDRLAVLRVLPAVPYDLILRSDRLEGFALGLTEDLFRAERQAFIDLLGADDLVPADDLDLTELRLFLEAGGVDITSLTQ